jgi:hypothetical protein
VRFSATTGSDSKYYGKKIISGLERLVIGTRINEKGAGGSMTAHWVHGRMTRYGSVNA